MCGSSGGGGARSLFGWSQLPWSHGSRSKARKLQTLKKKMRDGEERAAKCERGGGGGGGGEWTTILIFKGLAPLRHGIGLYAAAKHHYGVV